MKVLVSLISLLCISNCSSEIASIGHFFDQFKPQSHQFEQKFNHSLESFRMSLSLQDPYIIPGQNITGKLFNFSVDSIVYSGFSDFVLDYLNIDLARQSAGASIRMNKISLETKNIKYKSLKSSSIVDIKKAKISFERISYDLFVQFNVVLRRVETLLSFSRVEKVEVNTNGSVFGVPVNLNGNQPLLVDLINLVTAEANSFLDVFIKLTVNLALISI